MSGGAFDQLLDGGWIYAALRIVFIATLYIFLFIIFRATARELNLAARQMPGGDGRLARAALLVIEPAESSLMTGESIDLGPITRIGREAGNTILVDDPHTSARHAELRFARGQWWLRDLGSSNGTTCNGEPVRAVVGVRPGDDIQCGRVQFRLVPSVPVPAEHAPA